MHTHAHAHIHTHTRRYSHTCSVCRCVCVSKIHAAGGAGTTDTHIFFLTHTSLYIRAHTHASIRTHSYVHTHTHTHTHLYTLTHTYTHLCTHIHTAGAVGTGWRRCTGCFQLQVIFCKRAMNCWFLWRKMTYENKASHGSLPTCTNDTRFLSHTQIYIYTRTHTYGVATISRLLKSPGFFCRI